MINILEEIPEWKKGLDDNPKVVEALKDSYIKEKIKLAKEEGKKIAKKECEEPKTLGEKFQNFFGNIFPPPKEGKKKKPNAFLDHMSELGKRAYSGESMFNQGGKHNGNRK